VQGLAKSTKGPAPGLNQVPLGIATDVTRSVLFTELDGNVRWVARHYLPFRPCQWRPDIRVTAPRGQDVNPVSVCPGLVLQGHDPN
jgi:hypothetical protein